MNERIKELAEQAGLSYLYYYDSYGHAMVCSENDIKKLAELIVRECIGINDKHYDANIASDEIKEHFGVEE